MIALDRVCSSVELMPASLAGISDRFEEIHQILVVSQFDSGRFYRARSSNPICLAESGLEADREMRTLTGYGIAVVLVLTILNGSFWLMGKPQLRDLTIFSAGFVLGMFGMYVAAWLYGYRQMGVN